jgi:putative ABC transport system permease protein
MKFFPLVWAGMWRKRGRAILTLLSIANAFLLFGLLQGFRAGLDSTVSETHADVLITASRISQVEPLPLAQLAQIRAVPGVRAVTPVVLFHGTYQTPMQFVRSFAVDPEALARANPQSTIPAAQIAALKRTRTGALVPSTVATQYGWKVGDRLPLKSLYWSNRDGTPTWPIDVVAIYPTNADDLFFGSAVLVNFDYVDQGRSVANGTSSVFPVRVDDPSKAAEIGAAIDKRFANSPHETKTASERQLALDSIKQIGDVGLIVSAIMGAVFFALLLSVGAVMMQSFRERSHELAILKTLGFTDGGVLSLLLTESLLFSVTSAAVGLGVATALFPLVKRFIGFELRAGPVLLVGFLFAALLALATGMAPAIRAQRLQIVDALAGR